MFPTSVCEAKYDPRGANITRMLGGLVAPSGVDAIVGVHAVYQLATAASNEPYWPEGNYAVVFYVRRGDEIWGTRVRVADGGIVRIDFGCGPTPPEQLALPGAIHLIPGALEPSSGAGPGISVTEALSSGLSTPLLVNGHVVIAGGEMRLCQTLDQSSPPRCGEPSLLLEGFAPDPGTLAEESGVAWTSNEVQVLGERVGERLVVSDNVRVN